MLVVSSEIIGIVFRTAEEIVIAAAADELVVAAEAVDQIVAAIADQDIVEIVADQLEAAGSGHLGVLDIVGE